MHEVDQFVRPGETLKCLSYKRNCGGKGLNQSIAAAKAGAKVCHVGKIGTDGLFLKENLNYFKVNTDFVLTINEPTGHAIIQVNKEGENSIIITGGANESNTNQFIENSLSSLCAKDYLIIQNEVNLVPEIINYASLKGAIIVFNPAPYTKTINTYPLDKVDYLIVNQVEGEELTGKSDPTEIILSINKKYINTIPIITLGANGAMSLVGSKIVKIYAEQSQVVDTTAAGDTFIGYFVASIANNASLTKALSIANKAAAITVSREGAAQSIPRKEEVI